jgi:SARP family transcriptional regulator, regulator of embCAB operon
MGVGGAAVRIRILGSLEIYIGEIPATPTAPKPRSVLACLLLHLNETVPTSALIGELWGDAPPVSALNTLQTYVLHLRRMLGAPIGVAPAEVARHVLTTTPSGYRFHSLDDDIDLRAYEQLAEAGRRAFATADNETAADLLVRARNLWRGRALADVRVGMVLAPRIRLLEESRLVTIEQSVEARLRLGRHHEVIPELTALVSANRLHENLHAQLMLALHRSGRRQEALSVFHRVRAALRDEIGLEPSRRLHHLQHAILTDDPLL